MQHYVHKNQKGLLFTVGDSSNPDFSNGNKSQNKSSIYGNILSKSFMDNKDYYIFSTPTMFLLDSKREIILRPNSVNQMDAWVDWYLVQGNK